MSKTKTDSGTGIEHEEGSGNVFADLGLPDADARLARSKPAWLQPSHERKLLR
jgi:hypothetical protein